MLQTTSDKPCTEHPQGAVLSVLGHSPPLALPRFLSSTALCCSLVSVIRP